MAWSNLKKGPQNPNAKLYQTPKKGETETIPWCAYMKLWWNLRRSDNANNMLGSVYPGYDGHYTDELVLYESALNSKVKQGVSAYSPCSFILLTDFYSGFLETSSPEQAKLTNRSIMGNGVKLQRL